MRIVFFGTPTIAKDSLSFLYEKGVEIVGVVTKPDRPKGRTAKLQSPPVKDWVMEVAPKMPLFQPEKASSLEILEALKELKPDLFVVVAYGEILKNSLLEIAPLGAINLHASLLPRWRGAAPIQRALEAGDHETGVSIIRLVQKMDAGPVILKRSVPLNDEIRSSELFELLSTVGKEALLESITLLSKGTASFEIQDESLVTHAAKLTSEGCEIDWNLPGITLHNLVRASYPNPVAWTTIELRGERKKLNILKTKYVEEETLSPRELLKTKKSLSVGTGRGSLELLEVQQEGKKAMQAMDWVRGADQSLTFF